MVGVKEIREEAGVKNIREKTRDDVKSTQRKRREEETNKRRGFDDKDFRDYYDITVNKAYQSRKFRTKGKKYSIQFKDMSKETST